jgi:RNA polymerase sigma-70 factor (ECF subfamily)
VSTALINEANFEQVFKSYFGPLCNYVNSHIKDWENSREIVQGVFLKIWEGRTNLEITTSVKSYLYSAVRNRMIDYIRSNKKAKEYASTLDPEGINNEDKEMDSFLIREEILKSMEKMKPKMKKIFALSKMEGLTYSEIASYLNISKRAVEDNVAKALKHLKDDLATNKDLFG